MGIGANTLRLLMDAGVEGEALLAIVASIEADTAPPVRQRTAHAIRQERYRNRQASQNVTSDASRDATPPSPKENPQTPKETPPSTPKENPLRGQKKGSRLPDDFEPDFEFAAKQGLARSQAETEFAKFRDFWTAKPGAGGVKLDWQATWRNWVRTAVERGPQQRAGPQPSQPKPPQMADIFKLIKENGNGRQEHDDQRGTGAPVSYLPAVRSG